MDWQPCGIPDLPSPAHRRTASAALSSRARTARELPAQEFIEALLHWSIAAASGSPSGPGAFVTAGQLALLAEELALPETAAGPFGLEDLTDFFTESLNLEISGEPGGPTPATLDACPHDENARCNCVRHLPNTFPRKRRGASALLLACGSPGGRSGSKREQGPC